MTMAYEHGGVAIYAGSCLDVLPLLKAESVQCVVTSPPFFGLRDYGTATWDGGAEGCAHRGAEARTVSGGEGKQYTNKGSNRVYSGNCACGAMRIDQQIGLEATPAAYLAALVRVFRELWRVMKPDAVAWVEMGSSYAGAGYSNHRGTGGATRAQGGKQRHTKARRGSPEAKNGPEDGTEDVRAAADGGDEPFLLRDDLTLQEVVYVLTELAASIGHRQEIAVPGLAVGVDPRVASFARSEEV